MQAICALGWVASAGWAPRSIKAGRRTREQASPCIHTHAAGGFVEERGVRGGQGSKPRGGVWAQLVAAGQFVEGKGWDKTPRTTAVMVGALHKNRSYVYVLCCVLNEKHRGQRQGLPLSQTLSSLRLRLLSRKVRSLYRTAANASEVQWRSGDSGRLENRERYDIHGKYVRHRIMKS